MKGNDWGKTIELDVPTKMRENVLSLISQNEYNDIVANAYWDTYVNLTYTIVEGLRKKNKKTLFRVFFNFFFLHASFYF